MSKQRILYTEIDGILVNTDPILSPELKFIQITIDPKNLTGMIYNNNEVCYTCSSTSVNFIRRQIRKYLQETYGLFLNKEKRNNGKYYGITDDILRRITKDNGGATGNKALSRISESD